MKHFLRWLSLISLVMSIGVAGCTPSETTSTTEPVSGATPNQLAQPTKPLSTAADTISSNPQPVTTELNIWAVDAYIPHADQIEIQLQEFEQTHPNVNVNIYFKNSSGPANALSYLTAAKEIAPQVMPDIVMLDNRRLVQAWRQGVIEAMTGKIDRTIVQDLLPAATTLSQIDNELAGMPFELHTGHIVYNSALTTTLPTRWADVIDQNLTYQYPFASSSGLLNNASMMDFISTSPTWQDENGALILDEDALADLLTYYETSLNAGLIDPERQFSTSPETLEAEFDAQTLAFSYISVSDYLAEQRQLTDVSPAPLPTQGDTRGVVADGWFLALVTKDPTRQPLALKLIETMMTTESNAAWATRTGGIPSRQSAFELVANEDPYWEFLNTYLDDVVPYPTDPDFNNLSRMINHALQRVVTGEMSATDALNLALQEQSP